MAQTSGPQVLGAAAIVGVAVIAAGLLLGNSLDRVTQQLDRTASRLDDIRAAVADAKDALGNLQAAPAQAAARRGPDPNKRYTVTTKGSPARGPETAGVTIVEFSDFQ
jgi:protein-disulfide isomerase